MQATHKRSGHLLGVPRDPRWLGALLALLPACILFVPSVEASGSHCDFAGRETDCGRCLAANCAADIDACCLDDSCGGVIRDVEACATHPDPSCTRIRATEDRNGAHRSLSVCVVKRCSAECAAPSSNITACAGPATSIETCKCELSSTPNDVACTSIDHPKLRCCASDGWPGPALSCFCEAVSCVPMESLGGCSCNLTDDDSKQYPSSCSASGTLCCLGNDKTSCSCTSVDVCPSGATRVDRCTVDDFGCPKGRHLVDTCSVPK